MAKLNEFRTNARLLKEGEWIDLGEDWSGLRLKVRGQGRAYFDAKAREERRAADKHGGEFSAIPDGVLEAIAAGVAGEHLLIDVAELDGEDGPVTVEEYRKLMLDPDRSPMVVAVMIASQRLEMRARAEARKAAPFSAPPSAGG